MSSNSQTQALTEERAAHTRGKEIESKRCWSFVWWRPGGRGGSQARCDELNCLDQAPKPRSPQPSLSSPSPARGSFPALSWPWPPDRLPTLQGPPHRRGPSPAAPPPMMSRPWPPLGRPRAPPPPPLAPSPLGPPACDNPPPAGAPSLRLPLPRERRRRRDGQGPRPGPGERRAAATAAGKPGDRAPGGVGRSAAAPAAGAAARGSGRLGAPGHSGAWRRLRLLARRRPGSSPGRATAAVAAAPAATVAAAELYGRSLPLSDGNQLPARAPRAGGGRAGSSRGARPAPPTSDDRGAGQPPERASGAPPYEGAGSALSLLTGSQAAGESLHLPAPRPGRGGDSVGARGPAFTERAPERRACTEAPELRVALRSWRLLVPSGRAELRRPQPRREAILGSGGRPRTAGPYVPRTGHSAPRWAPPERGAAAAFQPGLCALLDAERRHPGLQHRGAEVRAPSDLALWLDRFVSLSSNMP